MPISTPIPLLPHPLPLSDMTHALQLSVAPVFLLTGIGSLLNLLAGRLARIIDRARLIEERIRPPGDPRRDMQLWELRALDRRMRVVSNGIWLFTASAIAISSLVAGLFIGALLKLGFGRLMAFAFILAMLLLMAGLVSFLIEAYISLRSARVPIELIEREEHEIEHQRAGQT